MKWIIYNCLFAIGYLLLLPKFLLRMARRGGYRKGFMQRFGRYDPGLHARLAEGGRVWVHAVSVGEVYVAFCFMEEWRRQDPAARFILTTTTSTGHRVAGQKLGDDDILLYFPADLSIIVGRVLDLLKPRALVLTENELWPNLLRACRRRNIPAMMINGRISASSHRGYRKLRWFSRDALELVDLFLVQSSLDQSRLLDLGAQASRVQVVGSAKYDVVQEDPESASRARETLALAGVEPEDMVLLGGSTWPGEEGVLLDIFKTLKPQFASLKLVLVPRHAERRAEVEAEITRRGLRHRRRSELSAGGAGEDVLLVDTTGELKDLYTAASLIFVGKSLLHTGGQNVIEPALPGKAIVVGPHLENFPDVAEDFLEANALLQVEDAEQLQGVIKDLLQDKVARDAYGARARALVLQRRGVVKTSVSRILEMIK